MTHEPTFGEAGQLVISSAMQLNAVHSSFTTPAGSTPQPATTSFAVAPTGDVFVVRNVSLGARVSYSHEDMVGYPAGNGISVGPRIGYNLPLGEHFSFWPSAAGLYSASWYGPSAHSEGLSVSAAAPFLYHPVSHLFVGFGPVLYTSLASTSSTPQGSTDDPRYTQYGAALTVGGWLPL